MSKFELSPEDQDAVAKRVKVEIEQEVELALQTLQECRDGKAIPAGIDNRNAVDNLLANLPSSKSKPEDFGLKAKELPALIEQYYKAIEE